MVHRPPLEGTLRVKGLTADVEVIRDRWGLPHLFAKSIDDAYFAQGFLAASERLFQLEMSWRQPVGRMAELLGKAAVDADVNRRTFGVHLELDRLAREWTELDHQLWGVWEQGVRAAVERLDERPIEFELLGADPTLPDNMTLMLSSVLLRTETIMWPTTILRGVVTEQLGPEAAALLVPPGVEDAKTGSNSWAVAGRRSASGAALVAYDPHLPFSMPAHMSVHMSAPGLDVAGATGAGIPGVVMARTPTHAWGQTSALGATVEIFDEQLNDDRTAARAGDTWEPLRVRQERIGVRGAEPHVIDVTETRHGPLIDGRHALQFVEQGPYSPGTLFRMATAADLDEFRGALRDIRFLHWNIVYGDRTGRIMWQLVGPWPRRQIGDGSLPLPGASTADAWDGLIPFDELPSSIDPPEGFVASGNAPPPGGRGRFGVDFAKPYRVNRSADLLAATDQHTADTIAAIQRDTVSLFAAELLPFLPDPLLEGWNGDLGVDSAPAALFRVWVRHLTREVFEPLLGDLYQGYVDLKGGIELPTILMRENHTDAIVRAHAAAISELTERFGSDPASWRWGDLHTLTFTHPLDALDPSLSGGTVRLAGDGNTVCCASHGADYRVTAGAVWRQVADLGDIDRSLVTSSVGNSGDPASPHYKDLVEPWSRGEHHPALQTSAAVRGAAESVLTLLADGAA
jgi:penicillin amidase